MNENDRELILKFKNRLPSDVKGRLKRIIVFGSRARGEAKEESDINVVKHSAVESAIGYYFAKPGRIDSKFHRMLMDARKIREIADYDIEEEIVEPTATLKIYPLRSGFSSFR